MSAVSQAQLRADALAIWQAGVEAVDSRRLVLQNVSAWKNGIRFGNVCWLARPESRICVVGAGKAGAGMALGLEQALGPQWLSCTDGWVNVPEDCISPANPTDGRTENLSLVNDAVDDSSMTNDKSPIPNDKLPSASSKIHLHPARPAGVNEPTQAGVEGTCEILQRVERLRRDDLCIVLISGGGDALLPAPVEGITLADKQHVTRTLMQSGATIEELNCVRRALSKIKGGGLLRACRAGLVVTLIISDVIGDPLEAIASGPTVDVTPDPKAALAVLKRFYQRAGTPIPPAVEKVLGKRRRKVKRPATSDVPPQVVNCVIGNNRLAVEGAAACARRRGYKVVQQEWDQPGVAADVGRGLAERLIAIQADSEPGTCRCLISGGEPTVRFSQTDRPQKGGRNQELVLAAVELLLQRDVSDFVLLSGGTDGEDGPTDAAGAWVDAALLERIRERGLDPSGYLRDHNSYSFFERCEALIKTGPLHTNVMDLRVGLVGKPKASC